MIQLEENDLKKNTIYNYNYNILFGKRQIIE